MPEQQPTAAAMRAAKAVLDYIGERARNSIREMCSDVPPRKWHDDVPALIDRTTGLPELIAAARRLSAAASDADERLGEAGLDYTSGTMRRLRLSLDQMKVALTRVEAPAPAQVAPDQDAR